MRLGEIALREHFQGQLLCRRANSVALRVFGARTERAERLNLSLSVERIDASPDGRYPLRNRSEPSPASLQSPCTSLSRRRVSQFWLPSRGFRFASSGAG